MQCADDVQPPLLAHHYLWSGHQGTPFTSFIRPIAPILSTASIRTVSVRHDSSSLTRRVRTSGHNYPPWSACNTSLSTAGSAFLGTFFFPAQSNGLVFLPQHKMTSHATCMFAGLRCLAFIPPCCIRLITQLGLFIDGLLSAATHDSSWTSIIGELISQKPRCTKRNTPQAAVYQSRKGLEGVRTK